MWRPQEVVPQHRRRAILVWALLIVSILSYFVLLLYRGVEKRENPNTSFVISDEIYTYPDVWVCLYDTYGCDDYDYEEQCVMSINDTEGGTTTALYRPGDEHETTIDFTAKITDERGWCVVFETSALDYNLGVDRDADDYIDYTRVDMYWYPGGSANNSTTCIQEEGEWTSHKENIFAFLSDPVSGEVSAGIQIPYSCMTNESDSHYFTYVGIGVTKENKISGEEKSSFNALTLSTVEWKDERTANITGIQAPYAYMSLELQQESNSMTVITEIDPLDMAEILGQVGGFWDLILILWPIMFVATSFEAPHLKPRNFRKSAARVTETVTQVLPTSRHGLTTSITERNARVQQDAEQSEDLPAWETEAASSRQQQEQQEDRVLIRLFEDHGIVAVVDKSSRVAKFLLTEFGARYLRRGAGEPALKRLLPPKTHIVTVPSDATAVSIATAIARHCGTGGDADEANLEPLTVKVTRVSCTLLQSQALAASSYVPADDDIIDETVVDLGEGIADRVFARGNVDDGANQQDEQRVSQRCASFRWHQTPRETQSPARRSFPGHQVRLTRTTDPRIGTRSKSASPPPPL